MKNSKIPLLVSVAEVTPEVLARLAAQGVGVELSYFSYPSNLEEENLAIAIPHYNCLLYTSPSPRDGNVSRMPSSA